MVNGSSDEEIEKKVKLSKNPGLDTSFLPDKNRDLVQSNLKETLVREFNEMQEKKKSIFESNQQRPGT